MSNKARVQFLLREHYNYGNASGYSDGYDGIKAGLFNSATFVKEALDRYGIETDLKLCFDANSIDKEVTRFKPTHCILEALWVPPAKLVQLVKLHPKVKFVVRIHSKITFLANEGMAVDWIKQYVEIPGVTLTFNEETTDEDFNDILIRSKYLPNIYKRIERTRISIWKEFKLYLEYIKSNHDGHNNPHQVLDVGCFGSIRPMKNQLLQAFAALEYCIETNTTLRFHINAPRLEQGGEPVLKNLRKLFEGTRHELVEHDWLNHDDFLKLVAEMDVGLQLSLTESFNIITADFVHMGVPIVVSNEIKWMPSITRADQLNTTEIIDKMDAALNNDTLFIVEGLSKLYKYNHESLLTWLKFLKHD